MESHKQDEQHMMILSNTWQLMYIIPQTIPRDYGHKIRPINSTLVVDDFGVKYSGKEHTLHLQA